MLQAIEKRLNILKPNPELESEWAELRALGNAYRELEAKIEAKMKTWNAISKKVDHYGCLVYNSSMLSLNTYIMAKSSKNRA